MGKRARRAKKAPRSLRRRTARVHVEALEIARGHDGLLRGHPEPVLVVGLFGAGDHGVTLLARDVLRFEVDAAPPLHASRADDRERVSARVVARDAASCIVVLVAIEQDSGQDVRAVFAALERVDAWRLWGEGEPEPSPLELRALATAAPDSAAGLDAHVLLDGRDLRDQLASDDLVGAAAVRFRDTGDAGIAVRVRFVSGDERNDWTAQLRVVHV